MSLPIVSNTFADADVLPLSDNWFSQFNDLARTSSSTSEQSTRRPALSPAPTRSLTSVPPSWSQSLFELFVSVHKNREKGLSIVSKGIKALPEQLGSLKSLETIFLNGNQLEAFPESIGELTHLSMLFAHNNHLKLLPDSLSQLEHLRFLDLHNNMLESLPNNFGASLGRLTELILFKNALGTLPPSIVGMKRVVKLELQYNCLRALPAEIGELVTLQVLNVAHNKLTSLPPEIGRLVNLCRLDLSSNQLKSLPESMAALKMLQSLWIDANQLSEVPNVILSLENLNLLSLRANMIGPTLPIGLSKLSKLIYIWMNENVVELLPEAIAGMQNLQDLYLSNNPCYHSIPTHPNTPINPNPIAVPSNLSKDIPSLTVLLAKQIIEIAKSKAPPSHIAGSSIIGYIEHHDMLDSDLLDFIDSAEDLCTRCKDPCWGYGQEHVYQEEWYPGQFIKIGWRHCWFCCRQLESDKRSPKPE